MHKPIHRLFWYKFAIAAVFILMLVGCTEESPSPVATVTPAIETTIPQPSFEPGQSVHLRVGFNGYVDMDMALDEGRLPLPGGSTYKLFAEAGDSAEIHHESGYGGWVPKWYLSDEAKHIQDISPIVLETVGGAEVFPYPSSQNEKSHKLQQGETLYAYVEYGDWYGVIAKRISEPQFRHGLLWISKSSVVVIGNQSYWFVNDGKSESASRNTIAAVYGLLVPGLSQDRVTDIFGPPSFVEASENLASTGEKVKVLPVWIYENKHERLEIRWGENKTVASLHYFESNIDGTTFVQPFMPSIQAEWEWRVKSDLAYNFLLEEIGDILLIAGEDGGLSGMHINSNLYALDEATGKKIWQFDLGYDQHHYGLSEDQSLIAFMKREKNKEGYEVYRMTTMEVATGKKVWERVLEPGGVVNSFQVAGNVISYFQHEQRWDDGSVSPRSLVSWDLITGKKLWEKEWKEEMHFISPGRSNVIVLQNESSFSEPFRYTLYGYDVRTGELVWQKDERRGAYEQEMSDSVRLASNGEAFWTRSDKELLLTDPLTGEDLYRLPIKGESSYEAIDGRYFFFREPVAVKSSLIDLKTGKSLFQIDGKASFGQVEGRELAYWLDGGVMFYDLQKGEHQPMHSERKFSIMGGPIVYFQNKKIGALPTEGGLYMIDSSGKATARIADARVGIYDITPGEFLRGYLTRSGDWLYVGSSNGFFSKMKSIGSETNDLNVELEK
ncbi:PQQ-binding-like beta-propeller repeat protein [Paenibacillus sp. GCM10027627]|uniref:outer membrane protein assembly factor BamB family protein n=1 Tax=unclassified Paenibacillus TaxID=185978 RepID=UPI00362DA9E1